MPDGTIAYTRDGSFQTDQQGRLVTSSGYQVLPAITIPQNATSLTIGSDGVVTITVAGSSTSQQVGSLQVATFINPTGLDAKGENLFAETSSSGAPNISTPGLNGAGTLNQGYVEASNVNVVQEELRALIPVSRARVRSLPSLWRHSTCSTRRHSCAQVGPTTPALDIALSGPRQFPELT